MAAPAGAVRQQSVRALGLPAPGFDLRFGLTYAARFGAADFGVVSAGVFQTAPMDRTGAGGWRSAAFSYPASRFL